MKIPKFPLGQVVATPGALEALASAGHEPSEFLDRHIAGDWGELTQDDREENERSVKEGFRILSAYPLSDQTKIWIITEAEGDDGNRQATTILLPEEY